MVLIPYVACVKVVLCQKIDFREMRWAFVIRICLARGKGKWKAVAKDNESSVFLKFGEFLEDKEHFLIQKLCTSLVQESDFLKNFQHADSFLFRPYI